MRIIFMGTPDFAVPALEAILGSRHEVIAVYCQPPRPSGRGHAERRTPVHVLAEAEGIAVLTPETLEDPAVQREFAALGADVAVVAAYGLILPKAILMAPPKGCINVHASLLPRWRGAAPIQRAILAGDEKTGITIMQMDEGLDTGPILAAEEVEIGPRTTAPELHDRLAALGARLALDVLDRIEAGTATPTPQPAGGATHARKLARAEGRLDWREGAAALGRRVRAFTPWPGAWFDHGGTRIKVVEAEALDERPSGAAPGEVLDGRLTVACGEGALRILRLQREGRAAQDAAAFLRGFPLPEGTRLGPVAAPAGGKGPA